MRVSDSFPSPIVHHRKWILFIHCYRCYDNAHKLRPSRRRSFGLYWYVKHRQSITLRPLPGTVLDWSIHNVRGRVWTSRVYSIGVCRTGCVRCHWTAFFVWKLLHRKINVLCLERQTQWDSIYPTPSSRRFKRRFRLVLYKERRFRFYLIFVFFGQTSFWCFSLGELLFYLDWACNKTKGNTTCQKQALSIKTNSIKVYSNLRKTRMKYHSSISMVGRSRSFQGMRVSLKLNVLTRISSKKILAWVK